MTKKLAMVFGVVFVLVGLLGFVSNPIVGEGKIFHTNLAHNLVHILLGAVLLLGMNKGAMVLKVVGAVYLLVAVLGFVMGGDMLLGLVEINSADNWLHLVLGVVLFASSFAGESNSSAAPQI